MQSRILLLDLVGPKLLNEYTGYIQEKYPMHGKLLSDQRVACHKQNIISFRITSCSKHCRHHIVCHEMQRHHYFVDCRYILHGLVNKNTSIYYFVCQSSLQLQTYKTIKLNNGSIPLSLTYFPNIYQTYRLILFIVAYIRSSTKHQLP